MKEIDRAVAYWAAVQIKQRNVRKESGKIFYYVECDKELLKKRKFNAYIALLAYYIARNNNNTKSPTTFYKKDLVDMYRGITGVIKGTAYDNVKQTISAIEWFVDFEGKYNVVDLSVERYMKLGVTGAKLKPYITLDETEMITLIQTKDPLAVKVYLKLKQLNSLAIANKTLSPRAISITGEKGLAASLGYSKYSGKAILDAMKVLQEHYLIVFTGNQYRPNNMGKYILINAIMGDNKQRWISYNLTEVSERKIVDKLEDVTIPMAFGNNVVNNNNKTLKEEEVIISKEDEEKLEELMILAQNDLNEFIPAPTYLKECEFGITNHSPQAMKEYNSLDDNCRQLIDIKYNII